MSRGTLRVYLGAAPGVGKTFAMLDEGLRRGARGTDVVLAFVETHGREHTAEKVEGLELIPRRIIDHRGASFTEMDLDAVLARRPEVALVDELAHTNVPGSRNAKRWQDVEELLATGIDVVTTVNIQHLESLNDVVESITGIRQHETVPDGVVRQADQIELVDMSPQALRRRLSHGNVYKPEKIDAALTNYFRVGNLTALRELALLWTADRVDAALHRYREQEGIAEPWAARERVVVALTGGPEGDTLIRRGARLAKRSSGGEVLVLHVSRADGLSGAAPDTLARQRALVEQLGGSFHTVVGDDVADAVLEFARGVSATQIVIGVTRRTPLASALIPGTGRAIIRGSGDIDVLVVTHEQAGRGTVGLRLGSALSRQRVIAGWLSGILGMSIITGALILAGDDIIAVPIVLMIFMTLNVGVALIGGLWPALVTALISGVLIFFVFLPPRYEWTTENPQNAIALLLLVVVAVAVSGVVDGAARRTQQAGVARVEADTLTVLAGSVLRGEDAVPALLERVRETFSLTGVALLQRADANDAWRNVGCSGDCPPIDPDEAAAVVPITEDLVLALDGRVLSASDMRVVGAIAVQAQTILERDQLRGEARTARRERERTATRTALLAAVSHDLRTPLAGIKVGVSALRSPDVALDADDSAELLATVEASTDRLQALIDNLLDMSRLDAGAVVAVLDAVALDEVVPGALAGVPADSVVLDVPETLPLVRADAGLLERCIANVVENAVRYCPAEAQVLVAATSAGGKVVLRVVDRGPGVPEEDHGRIFEAFQRLGDAPAGHGVGLGLAVARGLAEAQGATLEAEDTPGGGLTLVLTVPVAGPSVDPGAGGEAGHAVPDPAADTGTTA